MIDNNKLFEAFEKQAGVLKTSELRELGLSSRQISRLIETNVIAKLKHGFYERVDVATSEDVIIAKLFPDVILFLEKCAVLLWVYRPNPKCLAACSRSRSREKYL